MGIFQKALSLLFVYFFLVSSLQAQDMKTTSDSTSVKFMDQAKERIKNSNNPDSLRTEIGTDFFQYYLQHPETEIGLQAGTEAFRMWDMAGAFNKAQKALDKLDYDSAIWAEIVHPQYLFSLFMDEGKSFQEFAQYYQMLKDNITHPTGKSAVLWELMIQYHSQNSLEKTKEFAREIVNINANKSYVDEALGLLYEIESLSVGQQAPDFTATTVRGTTFSLKEQKGKIIVLEFWGTFCLPCIPEIPHLKSINAQYSEENVQVIGISLDRDREKLISFLQEKEINWPQIIQPDGYDDNIIKLYNVVGVPKSYIIGRDGEIVAKNLRGEELNKEIEKLVNN